MLRHGVHGNWCIEAMYSTVLCCNSFVLCNSVCADRSGMASPRLLEWYFVCSRVLRFCLWFASLCWQIALELLHHGCDLNVRICTKHCVFSGKQSVRCGQKLARLRDGCQRRRFAVESVSNCACSGTDGSR